MELDLAVAAATPRRSWWRSINCSRRSSRAKNGEAWIDHRFRCRVFSFRVRRFLQRPRRNRQSNDVEKEIVDLAVETRILRLERWAYSRWQDSKEIPGISYQPQNFDDQSFVNDLERPVFEKFVFLAQLKTWLLKASRGRRRSDVGSGSTVFAVLREMRMLILSPRRARAKKLDRDIWTCAGETI